MSLVLDGTNGLTFNNSSTQTVGGISSASQTWQDVTASRLLANTYTNSTGYPIMVSITCANAGSSGVTGFSLVVAGVTIASNFIIQQTGAGNYYTNLSAIVPNGATYNATGGISITLSKWTELR